MSSTLDSIRNALGYTSTPGVIRQALTSTAEGQAALDSAKATVQGTFSGILDSASQRVAAWKEANPEGLTAEDVQSIRQNLPASGDIATAVLDQLKAALKADQPLQTAIQNTVTPEMKTAAVDDFHSRVGDWKAAAIDRFKSNVADWKASKGISQKA